MWTCPVCNEENGELNGWCEYCYYDSNDVVRVYNPDVYYVRDIRLYHLSKGDKPVTPQEELFAKLFNDYKTNPEIIALSDLELTAKQEELSKIASEAKAGHYAIDEIKKERKKKKLDGSFPKGFETSLNIDSASSDAINRIKERQKRLTKAEQIKAGLEKLYQQASEHYNVPIKATSEAEKAMSATNILSEVNKAQNTSKPEELIAKSQTSGKPFFNPFAKKPDSPRVVAIETQTSTETKIEQAKPEEYKIINPFGKK